MIRDRVQSGAVDSVAEVVLDYEAHSGDTRALVVEGIRTGAASGDWSFSLEGLEALIARADEFGPPPEMLAAAIMQAGEDADPRLTDPAKYRVFSDPRSMALVMLVEADGQLWLSFWENVHRVTAVDAASP
jgi:hypothetical protein